MRLMTTLRAVTGVTLMAAACAASFEASAAAPSHVLIEAYGDSTTLGITCSGGHCGPQSQNAVAFLQADMRAAHGQHVEIDNLGVGGTMAYQLRDGTDRARGVSWAQRLAASNAQIVTINYGINEVMHNQTPEQFYDAETALVKTALSLGKQPVLQTSNPMPDNRLNGRLAAMVQMTRRVAAEQHVPLVDQYAYISALPDWKLMMSDGAHPRPALYRLKAAQDFLVVDPLVQRLLNDAGAS